MHESDCRRLVNEGSEEELVCTGYRSHLCTTLVLWLLALLSGGTSLLLFYWKPAWKVKVAMTRCALEQASVVHLQDSFKQTFVADVKFMKTRATSDTHIGEEARARANRLPQEKGDRPVEEEEEEDNYSDQASLLPSSRSGPSHDPGSSLYFDYCHVRYVFDGDTFVKLLGYESGRTFADFHGAQGVTPAEYRHRLALYGNNTIEVEVKSYGRLFIEEVLNPFYIFQIASIALWCSDQYYYYAACIFAISLVSIAVSLYETKKQAVTLHNMVKMPEELVEYFNGDNEVSTKATRDLVPGDVLVIPSSGCLMQCDAALVSGTAVVNESMLTGESVPVTKTALPSGGEGEGGQPGVYSPERHKRCTLFSGTKVIQTRYYGGEKVRAVVVRTGFNTAKGDLVRSILFPKPLGFKFYKDSIRFILVLFGVASLGMIYTMVVMLLRHEEGSTVVKRVLDIITVVVPPALPAAMTVGTVYAQTRLKKKRIFCISPPRINICGKLKLVCFDKTGTLTEDGLDMWGVIPADGDWFGHVSRDPSKLPCDEPFVAAMATCHSLTIIEGDLVGDPLDLKMFNSTEWILEEPGADTSRFDTLMPTVVKPPASALPSETSLMIGIVRQFTFTSDLQRMSVIARTLGKPHMDLYAKGAPEKIQQLCVSSTVPPNFADVLKEYTLRGFRVIAVAHKPLKGVTWHQAQRVHRDRMECDLTFLGLLIMQNTLKPETTPIIRCLRKANIRTVMVTGDNVLTAISVARECRMVNKHDRIVLIKASGPRGGEPAQLDWEYAGGAATSGGEGTTTAGDTSDPDIGDGDADHGGRNGKTHSINGAKGFTRVPSYNTLPSAEVGAASGRVAEYGEFGESMNGSRFPQPAFHYAVVGKTYAVLRQYFPHVIDRLLVRGVVFARMAPDQKAQVVEGLQDLGYGVGMCGDGANDCGALKVAHAGISLSEAEASVASPFTSQVPNISCVPEVIKEGRCALTTSFGVFGYMALYSLTQFVTLLILYTIGANLSDTQFLYIDLAITTTVAIFMSYSPAYPRLVRQRPMGSLVSVPNLFSIFSQIAFMGVFQLAAFFYAQSRSWYEPVVIDPSKDEPVQTYATTTLFLVSSFQYLTLSVCYSKGPPYRQPIYKNVPFIVSLVFLAAFSFFLLFYPTKPLEQFLQFQSIEPHWVFKAILALLVIIHFLLSLLVETFVVESKAMKRFSRVLRGKRGPKNRYKHVERELSLQPWPMVGENRPVDPSKDPHTEAT